MIEKLLNSKCIKLQLIEENFKEITTKSTISKNFYSTKLQKKLENF